MLFNSLRFAYFLPVVALAYFLAPRQFRVVILLLASCLFYASWDIRFLPLILGMTLGNYAIGLAMASCAGRRRASAALLAVGITGNLLTLALFKYLLFLLDNLIVALRWSGLSVAPPAVSVVLPLGISFFTFEFIHYLADVHGGQGAVRSLPKFAAFATFFPTQIAGPIKRYEDFVPQLDTPQSFDWTKAGMGIDLIVVGLFKKVALADNLAPIVLRGFPRGTAALGTADAWLVVIAFAFQIYFDFSGYTDIGRGVASLLGFHVPENFMRPYLARNISDFWRRWHISLSTWLRDYLYIPLGGNRRQRVRNLFVTMLLGGLWHGANWTFVAWGAWHGTLLVLYWMVHPRWSATMGQGRGRWRALASAVATATTFAVVAIGWVFFRANNLPQAASILRAMFVPHVSVTTALLPGERGIVIGVAVLCTFVEGVHEWAIRGAARAMPGIFSLHRQMRPVLTVCLLALTLLLKPSAGPRFLYFQF